jgi:hypothetical protein
MKWLILPETTVLELLRNGQARSWIAVRLPDHPSRSFSIHLSNGDGCLGKLVEIDTSVRLLLLWRAQGANEMPVQSSPLLSIWSEPHESTVWISEDEDRPELLER